MAAISAPQLNYLSAANVTDRAALPQNRVQTLIGSQAEFEITLIKDTLFIIY